MSDSTPNPSPAELWSHLSALAKSYYYQPPLDALRVVLAATHAHYWLHEKQPIWLQIVGPSSTGKTELGIRPLRALPNFHLVGSLTPNTLLSGKDKDKHGQHSLLYRVGEHGILGMSDFSQFLEMSPWDRGKLVAKLRDLHDGHQEHATGHGTKTLTWSGKVTLIVAATPAVERYWAVTRDLGDRFLTVRWPAQKPSLELAQRVHDQLEAGEKPLLDIRSAVKDLVYRETKPAKLSQEQVKSISQAAFALSELRRGVPTDDRGRVGAPSVAEGPSRVLRAFLMLARAHGALFGREAAAQEDVEVIVRIAADSIPAQRCAILRLLPLDNRSEDLSTLAKNASLPHRTCQRQLEALVAIGAVGEDSGSAGKFYSLTPEFVPHVRALDLHPKEKVVGIR